MSFFGKSKVYSFDFVAWSKVSFMLSAIFVLLSLFSLFNSGFNLGTDFVGGIKIDLSSDSNFDVEIAKDIAHKIGITNATVQSIGDQSVSIKFGGSNQSMDLIVQSLQKHLETANYSQKIHYDGASFIGPQVGKQMLKDGVIGIVLALLAIMLYVLVRFEWRFSIGIIVALLCNLILCLGIISYSRLEFDLSTVAALLTVLGYSVNDSVVVYDRVRENTYKSSYMKEIVNNSINQTLSRTLLTSLTTVIANVVLVYFGSEVIRGFSLIILCGVVIGTLSSIFIAAPILTQFRTKRIAS